MVRGTICLNTMALTPRTLSIIGSLVLSLVLVSGAYFFSSPLFGALMVDAESGEELLKSYAEKDTDADGLLDWEETLYKTDPNDPHSVDATLTDGEAVAKGLVKAKFVSETPEAPIDTDIEGVDAAPDTLTDEFSREFYAHYLTSRGGDLPSSAEIASFVQDAVADLDTATASRTRFTKTNLQPGGSGVAGLTTYATNLRGVLNANSPTKTEKDALENFGDFVNGKNSKALARVTEVGRAYEATATALMRIGVPSEVALTHLSLANAYASLAEATLMMGEMDTDPLRAFIGLSRYDEVQGATAQALIDMGTILQNSLPQ